MVSSVSGVTGTTNLLASFVKEAATAQAVEVAVLKKGQDVEKANGEAALSLIESVTAQKIDVRV